MGVTWCQSSAAWAAASSVQSCWGRRKWGWGRSSELTAPRCHRGLCWREVLLQTPPCRRGRGPRATGHSLHLHGELPFSFLGCCSLLWNFGFEMCQSGIECCLKARFIFRALERIWIETQSTY